MLFGERVYTKSETLNEKTVRNISKTRYAKNKILNNLHNSFIKSGGKANEFSSKKVVLTIPFIQEKLVIWRSDMLHTIDGPMQLIRTDLRNLHFFSKSTVAPKYYLVCLDLFTSKTYTYQNEKKSQLSAKLEKFYPDTENLREHLKEENRHQMWLQTDQEFNQNEIAEINKKHNVLHYNSKLNDGHAVGAQQKIRELTSHLRNFKRLVKKGKVKPSEA